MLSTIELIDLTNTHNLPTVRFFDWDDQAKDIVLTAWFKGMRDADKEAIYDDAGVWFFDTPAPYVKLVAEDKNAIYSILEEQLIELVDQVHGEDEPLEQWGTA